MEAVNENEVENVETAEAPPPVETAVQKLARLQAETADTQREIRRLENLAYDEKQKAKREEEAKVQKQRNTIRNS